jgi:HEAT repeat protein
MRRDSRWLLHIATAALGLTASIFCVNADAASGDMPEFKNARVETRTLQQPLASELHTWTAATRNPRWLGYAVPQANRESTICCSNYSDGSCGTCSLEKNRSGSAITSQDKMPATVHLEGSADMAMMFRAENGKLSSIRFFSLQCAADAGGLDVLWLENVKPGDSVDLLEHIVLTDSSSENYGDSLAKDALAALALHADPSADRALESFVDPNRPESLRKQTSFWLGEARAAAGLRILQKMAQRDTSSEVRKQVTFALSVSREPAALQEMIRMAHEDQNSEVRGQALFWLAHKAGKQAETAITGAIENDPDTEVKKKAVFALSQMPKDEGVPKLIEVAQNNKNPEVRKQAMFWLGQTNDPRALAFFEKVLAP